MSHSEEKDAKRDVVLTEIVIRLEKMERRLRLLERAKCGDGTRNNDTCVRRFLETISIVGCKEMSAPGVWPVRLIWIMIFGVCILSTGYFIYKTMLEYLKEPTATKVKLIEQAQYEYPIMLLCPDTWLDADKANRDGLSMEGLQYALGFLINYYVRPPPYKIRNYDRARGDFLNYYQKKRFTDLVQFFKFVALDSEDFFYQCPFCVNTTFPKILMSDSICYQIPMHSTPGNAPVVNSLDHLDVVVPDRTGNLLAPASYWRLFLGLDMQLGEATGRHAEIYPHQSNTIQFITHKFVSVDKPDNRCVMESRNYSFARCVLQCFLEDRPFLMTACSLDSCDNSRLAPNQTFNYYAKDLWEKLATLHSEDSHQKSSEAPKYCYDNCPSPCQRMIYTIDVQSHKRLPIPDLTPSGSASSDKQAARSRVFGIPENLTRLSFLNTAAVYGGVLTFEEVSTYSFETMVGNVGGMLSLWLGVSIMSLIQIAMFLMTEWFLKSEEKPSKNHLCMASGALLERSTVV